MSEENGVLISTILRQYFMSLKVLGKWKRWGKSMTGKFDSIQTNLQKHGHAFHEPSPTSPTAPRHPNVERVVNESKTSSSTDSESEDPDADEDEDDGALYDASAPIAFSDRQIEIIRRVMRKWWRVAGLKGHPELCDELGGGEFVVNWTKAIAPRLEGRIREVGGGARIEA